MHIRAARSSADVLASAVMSAATLLAQKRCFRARLCCCEQHFRRLRVIVNK
jgi:hypothetical protein